MLGYTRQQTDSFAVDYFTTIDTSSQVWNGRLLLLGNQMFKKHIKCPEGSETEIRKNDLSNLFD